MDTLTPEHTIDYRTLILEKEQLEANIEAHMTKHMEKHRPDIISDLKDFVIAHGKDISNWQDIISKLEKVAKDYITEYPMFQKSIIVMEAQAKYLLFKNNTIFKKELPYKAEEKLSRHFSSVCINYCTHIHTNDLIRFHQLDRDLYVIE